jgi:hypothetical protein
LLHNCRMLQRFRIELDARGNKSEYTVATMLGEGKAVALAVLEHLRLRRPKSISDVSIERLPGDSYEDGDIGDRWEW